MVKIIWTEFAVEDLRSIHDYISKDSKHYADRYVDKIITRVEQLETNPQSGRVVPEFNLDKVRELLEGRYRIIYKINDGYIVLVRIQHSARQLKGV
jgi:toxin ParE1/3/4